MKITKKSITQKIRTLMRCASLTVPLALAGFSALIILPGTSSRAYAQTLPLSNIHHVFIILMENHDWSAITPSAAPYMWNTLIPSGSYANNYHNVLPTTISLHPSEPNYVYLEGGTNVYADFTFTTDNNASSTNSTNSTAHLATMFNNKGLSWKAYQENMPTGTCPINSSGQYAAKHDPFVFFQDISGNPPSTTNTYCTQHHAVLTTTQLQNDLASGNVANYNFLTPNLCNDMHDCSVTTGDTWLSQLVPIIMNSALYKQDGLILITWDEGGSGNNPIGMILLSPFVKQNYTNSIAYSHASTVKTVENIFGLTPYVGHANDSTIVDLSDFFSSTPTTPIPTVPPTNTPIVTITPTPTKTPTPIPPSPTPTVVATTTPIVPSATNSPTPTPGCPVVPSDLGVAVTTADIPSAGNYVVWSRINPWGNADSYYIQIDNDCAILVGNDGTLPSDSWSWVNYRDGIKTSVISTNLTVGTHRITMIGTEAGLRIDRLLLTADTTCTPTNLGTNCDSITLTPTPTSLPPTPTFSPTPTSTLTPTLPVTSSTPTPTPKGKGRRIKGSLLLNGIGYGGDAQSPGSPGNFAPLHPTRVITLEFYETPTGPPLATAPGSMSFNATTGGFDALIPLDLVQIPDGSYLLKAKTSYFVRQLVPGFITLDQSNVDADIPIATVTLIAGDSTNDNALDILDYNIIADCYSDLAPPRNCSDPTKKIPADLNDDGNVNGTDINYLIRNATVRSGG